MKWVTRERMKVRVACPWLIRNFVDPEAEFLFAPADKVLEVARAQGATPYDVPDVELGHHEGRCSFEAIVERYGIDDPAIRLLARIIRDADVPGELSGRPESAGLRAIIEGFRHLGGRDDPDTVAHETVLYDALYAYCRRAVIAPAGKGWGVH